MSDFVFRVSGFVFYGISGLGLRVRGMGSKGVGCGVGSRVSGYGFYGCEVWGVGCGV